MWMAKSWNENLDATESRDQWSFELPAGQDSWPLEGFIEKMTPEERNLREERWRRFFEKWSKEHVRQASPEELARFKAIEEKLRRPKTYYERLYEGVEYDPYTGELVSVPEGSIELEDGSWLIPDVDPDPPEEAFGKNGERLEPYSKKWNAYMRDNYFNWPLYHDESGPTCSLAFQR